PIQEPDQCVHILTHLKHRFEPMAAIARGILKIGPDIAAGAESAASAGDDDNAYRIVVSRIRHRGQDFMYHRLRISVERSRAIQRYRRDVPVFHVNNLFEFIGVHRRSSTFNWGYKEGPSGAIPPSTTSVSPVVPIAWAAKKKVAQATSSTVASLRIGV